MGFALADLNLSKPSLSVGHSNIKKICRRCQGICGTGHKKNERSAFATIFGRHKACPAVKRKDCCDRWYDVPASHMLDLRENKYPQF